MANTTEVKMIAPGRICLFGDHQDYLGLPVIACAINRFVEIKGVPNQSNSFQFEFPDLNSSRKISIDQDFKVLKEGDHLASVLRVVQRYGCMVSEGFDIGIKGNIPVNAGLSSSSAVVVAWTRFLLNTFGCDQEVTNDLIARIAYEAEVVEQNSPGGRMDQYTIALGDIIFLETDDNANYQKIGNQLDGLIIGESGIPKNTVGLLGDLRGKALQSIEVVQNKVPNFDLQKAVLPDIEKYSHLLTEELKAYFYAAIKNYTITQEALKALKQSTIDYSKVGHLMNEHHRVLKEVLKITTPKIDAMIDAALEAGAYGAKIVGSGGGGSICALAPKEKQQDVINSIAAVGKDSYAVKVTSATP